MEDAVQKKAFPAVLHWFGASEEKCTFTAFPQIWEQYAQSENVPAIMGRIVHLERFVCCLKIKKEQEWKIRLTDSLARKQWCFLLPYPLFQLHHMRKTFQVLIRSLLQDSRECS